MVSALIDIQAQRENDDEKIRHNFTSKKLAEADEFPSLETFPLPIARLIVQQLHAARERIENGEPTPAFERAVCFCLFFRRYHLPCKHLFHNQLVLGPDDVDSGTESTGEGEEASSKDRSPPGVLTAAAWDEFGLLFEEGAGYDVWTATMRVQVDEETPDEPDNGPRKRKERLRESLAMITDGYYRLEEEVASRRANKQRSASQKRKRDDADEGADVVEQLLAEVATVATKVTKWQFHGAKHGCQV